MVSHFWQKLEDWKIRIETYLRVLKFKTEKETHHELFEKYEIKLAGPMNSLETQRECKKCQIAMEQKYILVIYRDISPIYPLYQ